MKCPSCGNEFDEKTGRRPKKFCSDPCKVKFWNAFKKMQKGANDPKVKKAVKESVNNLSDFGQTATHIPSMTTGISVENVEYKLKIQEEIDKHEAEIKTLGVGQWACIRKNGLERKIQQLQKLLKQ